jgi:hypothetical protein
VAAGKMADFCQLSLLKWARETTSSPNLLAAQTGTSRPALAYLSRARHGPRAKAEPDCCYRRAVAAA